MCSHFHAALDYNPCAEACPRCDPSSMPHWSIRASAIRIWTISSVKSRRKKCAARQREENTARRPAHQPVRSEAVTLADSAVCSAYQLCGCSMPSLGVRPARETHKVWGDKGCSDWQIKSSKSV